MSTLSNVFTFQSDLTEQKCPLTHVLTFQNCPCLPKNVPTHPQGLKLKLVHIKIEVYTQTHDVPRLSECKGVKVWKCVQQQSHCALLSSFVVSLLSPWKAFSCRAVSAPLLSYRSSFRQEWTLSNTDQCCTTNQHKQIELCCRGRARLQRLQVNHKFISHFKTDSKRSLYLQPELSYSCTECPSYTCWEWTRPPNCPSNIQWERMHSIFFGSHFAPH